MSYRDILVQVDEKAPATARVAAAADIARRADGFLSGVFLESNFLGDYMTADALAYMSPAEIDALLKDHAKVVDEAAEAARMTFEAAAAKVGVQSDWRRIPGRDDSAMLACARRADLTVFPAIAQVSMARYRIAAGNLAMAVGGPVLVTPEKGYAPDCGKRILIAWNGSREAARALRDAWPLVMAADEVHVLVVAPEGDAAPDGLLQRHLERHGCAANIIVDPSLDEAASDILRRQIASLQADLLVMGLYGRPRFQEMVLGGVSREMLNEPPVPILLSH